MALYAGDCAHDAPWFPSVRESCKGRAEVDTFPTLYRSNTKGDVVCLASESGLVLERLERIEGRPEYMRLFWPLYFIGAAYERIVNASPILEPFRILLVGTLRKPMG